MKSATGILYRQAKLLADKTRDKRNSYPKGSPSYRFWESVYWQVYLDYSLKFEAEVNPHPSNFR